jgi:preprotein translocase subunit SecA
MVQEVVGGTVEQYANKDIYPEEWDLENLHAALASLYPTTLSPERIKAETDAEALVQAAVDDAMTRYDEREQTLGADNMRQLERIVLLSITDNKWREHLYEIDYMEEGIHLRAYGQKDPLVEFQREAYTMFDEMKGTIVDEFVRYIYRVELVRPEDQAARPRLVQTSGPSDSAGGGGNGEGGGKPSQVISDKVPRNAPCPCGSGRKYKKCHGAVA